MQTITNEISSIFIFFISSKWNLCLKINFLPIPSSIFSSHLQSHSTPLQPKIQHLECLCCCPMTLKDHHPINEEYQPFLHDSKLLLPQGKDSLEFAQPKTWVSISFHLYWSILSFPRYSFALMENPSPVTRVPCFILNFRWPAYSILSMYHCQHDYPISFA